MIVRTSITQITKIIAFVRRKLVFWLLLITVFVIMQIDSISRVNRFMNVIATK